MCGFNNTVVGRAEERLADIWMRQIRSALAVAVDCAG
jgi:hypothetical protein